MQWCVSPCPGEYPRLCPLHLNMCAETKKYGPNERPGQNSRKKKTLSDKEIDNLSDADFKTLKIRMFTEMIELGCKLKEEIGYTKWNKGKYTGNQKGKETRIQINDLKQKRRNKHPTGTEWKNKNSKKKIRRGLGTSRTSLNVPTSESQRCQKEKRKKLKLTWKYNEEELP